MFEKNLSNEIIINKFDLVCRSTRKGGVNKSY